MGAIQLVSAVLIPVSRGPVTKTPPIPNWPISGIRVPTPRRWVGLWGYRAQTMGLGNSRREAQKKGLSMYTATVIVNIEKARMGSVSIQHIPDLECLPIDQASASLKQELMRIIESQPKNKTTAGPKRSVWRRDPHEVTVQLLLTRKPDLINKIFGHPDFRHIKIITWGVSHNEGYGAIRDPSCVHNVFVRGLPPPYSLDGWSQTWTPPTAT